MLREPLVPPARTGLAGMWEAFLRAFQTDPTDLFVQAFSVDETFHRKIK